MRRRTIAIAAEVRGIGLHSGALVTLRMLPAASGSGIVFYRHDLPDPRPIPADLAHVAATERRTALRSAAHRIDTVEHLLAAVVAHQIDDLTVEVDGPEIPILDGSFAPFDALIRTAGVREHPGIPTQARLRQPLEVVEGEAWYLAVPADRLSLEVGLEYTEPVIGHQRVGGDIECGWFQREIAGARTYGFLHEVEPLQARGLLAGASEGCAIVLAPDRPLNTTLRWPDEFARHKLGDLLGDLALLGARLMARITAHRPSHRGNIALTRALARAARFTEE